MSKFETQLKKEAGKIRMRSSERNALRERVIAYMEYHPRSVATPLRARRTAQHIPFKEAFSYISTWKFGAGFGTLAIALIAVVSTAAEYTAPGDVLYPVKTQVNEEVLSQLSFTPYQKIAWETKRVERRISEARLLAKEGRLTNEAEVQITDAVKEHTQSAKREIAALRKDDADDAAVAQVVLESALDVQSAVLENDQSALGTSTGTTTPIQMLADTVKDAKEDLGPVNETSTLSSYERFLASVEEATTRAQELFISVQPSLSTDEHDDIQRRLDDVGREVDAAKDQYDASTTDGAVDTLKDALRNTQKLISFMTDIDVRSSVALDDLVPMQLTHDERVTAVKEAREELGNEETEIEGLIASSTNDTLNEKALLGLNELKDSIAAIDITLPQDQLESAEHSVEVGQGAAEDLYNLFGEKPHPIPAATDMTDTTIGSTTSTSTDASSTPEVQGTTTATGTDTSDGSDQ